jgi:hypothetical protein
VAQQYHWDDERQQGTPILIDQLTQLLALIMIQFVGYLPRQVLQHIGMAASSRNAPHDPRELAVALTS